jgi:hypothetical protein
LNALARWTLPAALAATLAAPSAQGYGQTPDAAGPDAAIQVAREGKSERLMANLGGVLMAAVSPESNPLADGLLLLVRPAREADGPRQLLRLRLEPEPRLERLADGLDGRLHGLVAIEFAAPDGELAEPHLIAYGSGLLLDLGALADPAAEGAAPVAVRPLAVDSGFDPASLAPPTVRRGIEHRLAAVEPGRLLLWEGAGSAGALREVALPVSVARTGGGLRLSSPAVTDIANPRASRAATFLVGPEPVGSVRLRSLRLDLASAAGEAMSAQAELWASLPGPESVSQSWPFEIDGVPVVVVRTQGSEELNLFERQRLRVLPLVTDRTRAGAAPTLAIELDSKRWHETAIALGDVDGDGRDDLLAAFPEGLSGSDLVVQWWRGMGAGKFDAHGHRSDIDSAPSGWALLAERGGAARPGLLLVGDHSIEWRPFAPNGKAAIVERGELAGTIPSLMPGAGADSAKKGKREVKVGADGSGASGDSAKVVNEDPVAEPLGGAELDGRPGLELLAVQAVERGDERLIVLRLRPD